MLQPLTQFIGAVFVGNPFSAYDAIQHDSNLPMIHILSTGKCGLFERDL